MYVFFRPPPPALSRPFPPVVNSIPLVVAVVVVVECKSGENIVNAHLEIRAQQRQARHKFTSVTVRFYWNKPKPKPKSMLYGPAACPEPCRAIYCGKIAGIFGL